MVEGCAISAVAAPLRLQQPAEWAPQRALWAAYPSHRGLWRQQLEPAQRACLAMCKAFAATQHVRLLVRSAADGRAAQAQLAGLDAEVVPLAYGDIWLRDTAPLFVHDGAGAPVACCFGFNGWGGKYWYDEDRGLNRRIAALALRRDGVTRRDFGLILEGGSVDCDGQGTLLTTGQCLGHPNRNPWYGPRAIEKILCDALGARTVLWLERGLAYDHTDGHIDNVARFVCPGHVVCMAPTGPNDPNGALLGALPAQLGAMHDACGRRLQVTTLPSPGAVYDADGQIMAASYMNFVVGNHIVVMPSYNVPTDALALQALQRLFVGRRVIALDGRAILTGGGSFHCMTQPQFQ